MARTEQLQICKCRHIVSELYLSHGRNMWLTRNNFSFPTQITDCFYWTGCIPASDWQMATLHKNVNNICYDATMNPECISRGLNSSHHGARELESCLSKDQMNIYCLSQQYVITKYTVLSTKRCARQSQQFYSVQPSHKCSITSDFTLINIHMK
jgi:hypothetical protein